MCAVKSQLRESSILLAERKSNKLPSKCDVYAEPTLEELECRNRYTVLSQLLFDHLGRAGSRLQLQLAAPRWPPPRCLLPRLVRRCALYQPVGR